MLMKFIICTIVLLLFSPITTRSDTLLRINVTYCDVWGDSVGKIGSSIPSSGCFSIAKVSNINFSIYKVSSGKFTYVNNSKPIKIIKTNADGLFVSKLKAGFYIIKPTSNSQLQSQMPRYASAYCNQAVKNGDSYGGGRLYFLNGTIRLAKYELYDRCPV